MTRLPSHFNAETKQNALLGFILIVKTSGSRGLLIQDPFVKMRYSLIPFCEVLPKKRIHLLGMKMQKGHLTNSNKL